MRWFETRGPVYPEDNYVVARADELADFVKRIERGRYIVLFAPRQTGKTTLFRNALTTLEDERDTYFPIHLNIQDEFKLSNFTPEQVHELLSQYTDEVGQPFTPETIAAIHKQADGLEQEYLPEDNHEGFQGYLTSDGQIQMAALLDNFSDFITRVGFRILQVPDTPQEYVGQHLLFAYLEQFVQSVGGTMYLEVRTGRGRMDILILHRNRKYIVETKIWGGSGRYQSGKSQLAAYVRSEGAEEGYYVVFDHRNTPEPRVETETIDRLAIRSYVIPVIQETPSSQTRFT